MSRSYSRNFSRIGFVVHPWQSCLSVIRSDFCFISWPSIIIHHWYTPETEEKSKLWSSSGEGYSIGRNGNGRHFPVYTKGDIHQLPGEGQKGHRTLLCQVIGPIRIRSAPLLKLSNWSNEITNCPTTILRIIQICHRVSSFCVPNLKNYTPSRYLSRIFFRWV